MELENKSIHLTDISFSKFCEFNYKINRGMYNTIDIWLYEQGETDILSRRRSILDFLNFSNESSLGKMRFGKGGLSKKLNDFFSKDCVQ